MKGIMIQVEVCDKEPTEWEEGFRKIAKLQKEAETINLPHPPPNKS